MYAKRPNPTRVRIPAIPLRLTDEDGRALYAGRWLTPTTGEPPFLDGQVVSLKRQAMRDRLRGTAR
jgi:hypothetical protein